MSDRAMPDPISLFERATRRADAVMAGVAPAQLSAPTPCSAWTVQQLIDHMVGGTAYLLSALSGRQPSEPRAGASLADYRAGVAEVLAGLREPGALERRCQSPLNFEWSLGEATAGTFMDQLIHTWDLATSTGQDATLDPELVAVCSAMFLPDMPEMGRAGGLVGPPVAVPDDASPQARLLGAMGRQP
ncbi:MAG: TIGR03086 family metal-binding protein [Chloroflexota bacterium]